MKILKQKKYKIFNKISKIVPVVFTLSLFVFPAALVNGEPGAETCEPGAETCSVTIVNKIKNPLGDGNLEDIPAFIQAIIKIVITIGIPIVTLAIIYTGFLFVQAQGNPEKIKKAKNALTYTLIGAALLLGAFVISEAIIKTVGEIKS